MNDNLHLFHSSELEIPAIFCETKRINDHITFYYDDSLPGMYDFNFFDVTDALSINDLELINKSNPRSHIKIQSCVRYQWLIDNGFSEIILLTMFNENSNTIPLKKNAYLKTLIDNREVLEDIFLFQTSIWSDSKEFTRKKLNHYVDCILSKKANLDIVVMYNENNEFIGEAEVINSKDFVGVDGLYIKEEFQKQGYGTTLLGLINRKYNKPIYLHADDSETAKNMYTKLGFVVLNRLYDYYKVIKNNE